MPPAESDGSASAGAIVHLGSLVGLMAPTLGDEKSRELLIATARSLGYDVTALSREQAREILTRLASAPGIVGVAARFAAARRHAQEDAEPHSPRTGIRRRPLSPPPPAPSDAGQAGAGVPPPSGERIELRELVALLAPTLGTEKSEELVGAAMLMLGFPRGPIERRQALAILELSAKAEGIVGIASRFAKARLILG